MKRLALDIALIGRLAEEPLQQERALREAQTQAITAESVNRWEISRRAFTKQRQGFQRSPSP